MKDVILIARFKVENQPGILEVGRLNGLEQRGPSM